ncbi:MAG: FecR domain-containing protein [Tannerella sp.]|jgi:ferric-dicitrate binding protein FerR (iron transport regulator)|nr:FecR domain-containing protein [Tannerella sp.]
MESNENINRLLFNYLNGNATVSDLQELKVWITSAPENRRAFNETVNIWQGAHPAFNPAEINVEKAEKQLFAKIGKKSFFRQTLQFWQRAAAILVIPLLLYSLYLFNNKDINYTETTYQETTVPYGMYSAMNLPDGSKVWLNGGSSLKYPLHFTSANREVELHGEGYFEVKSDKKNPFTVKTGQMTLQATGTAFNIASYDSDSITAVTMVDGVINVAFGNNNPVQMTVNERIAYNSRTDRSEIQQINPTNDGLYKWYSWKDGVMILRDDPLSAVFKQLEQVYNIEFIVREPDIANAIYRATFRQESLDEILRLLEMTAPIQFVYNNRIKPNNVFEKQRIEVRWRRN